MDELIEGCLVRGARTMPAIRRVLIRANGEIAVPLYINKSCRSLGKSGRDLFFTETMIPRAHLMSLVSEAAGES